MDHGVKLRRIPEDAYPDYYREVIFKSYKWDPQNFDENTIANHAVLMSRATADWLEDMSERLAEETMMLEETLAKRPDLVRRLSLPRKTFSALMHNLSYDRRGHVRFMRFDFHPTTDGWTLSEVNSDVPGGLAESAIMTRIAEQFFNGYARRGNVALSLLRAFTELTGQNSVIAFLHCTSYAEDRQVVQFTGDYFEKNGLIAIYAAPDHIRWEAGRARSILIGAEGKVDGIIRYFPVELIEGLPYSSGWRGFFSAETPSCNHPIVTFTQTKRLPLVWDELDVHVPTWKALLPTTTDPRGAPADFIFKPALGRVGDGISIREAIDAKELARIEKDVRRHSKDWVAQRRFQSSPLFDEDGVPKHLCVGVHTVNGKAAGFYGRVSRKPLINELAEDIAVLCEEDRSERV